jgi:predicted RNA-binding Zn-ribbon protein involved in translation (DUF1610 family)
MMKKTRCYLNITAEYECPHCEKSLDLFETDLTDDGWLYQLLMPDDNHWSGACKDFSKEHIDNFGEDFSCPECGEIIDIGEVTY